MGILCYCDECIDGRICDTWTVHNAPKSTSTDIGKPSPPSESYKEDDFIAVIYVGAWYVGRIVEIDPDDDGFDYRVTFMQKKKALFQWPSNEDVVWRKKSHILCKTSPPIASGKSERMYRLSKEELEDIESRFSQA